MNNNSCISGTDTIMQSAIDCFNRENIPQAEAYCRHLLSLKPDHTGAYILLGDIALKLSLPDAARGYYDKALTTDSGHAEAATKLKHTNVSGEKCNLEANTRSNAKFLLIKAWGYGFWADIDHVLGQLLLAEITGRTPVVYWGENSLFRRADSKNAFTLYYEPVSGYSIDDLQNPQFSVFPGKWNLENLHSENVNKWSGEYSRMAGIYYLSRKEEVAVSDFHTYVKDLMPWVPRASHLYGQDPQAVYRYLFGKYLRLRPELQNKISSEWMKLLKGKRALAVHVRGSDKIHEDRNLHETHMQYHQAINELLEKEKDLYIFILTDSKPILDEYIEKYGERLIHTNCNRSSDDIGVHLKDKNKYQLGIEVLTDVYLASACEYFLGSGNSNVSTTILHTKYWPQGKTRLLGHNFLFGVHLGLHNRKLK